MTKISIPHIHKIEGEAGFWAEVTKTGKITGLKIETLTGLRQIEGILVGRKVQEIPTVVSRICGICPVVHILNACSSIEKALGITISPATILLRKLFLASQIVHSHALHLFFLALPDFFDINNDLDLLKKFPKEANAALKVRDFSLEITKLIGGRKVHPMASQVGGFLKMPEKEALRKILADCPSIIDNAITLVERFKKLSYPTLKRKTQFISLSDQKEYSFYSDNLLLVDGKKITVGDFYANEIEEDLKVPPIKRTKYRGKSYMAGSIARIENNSEFLSKLGKEALKGFMKEQGLSKRDFSQNIFYNLFSQAVEVLHFLETSQQLLGEILEVDLKEGRKELKIRKGAGLSVMEAPRGTLFTYFEIDKDGRVSNCNIITPTAQFLNNLEEDLRAYLPGILGLSQEEKIRKIRALIRVYDPCISCATH